MKSKFVLIFSSTLLLLISFFLCIVVFFLFFYVDPSDSSHNISRSYHYTEINFLKDSTTHGFTNLPQELKNEEYLSFSNEETGSFVVISNFEGQEYECKGTCSCTTPSRRSSSILNRAVFILFSAFSTSMALRISEEAFKDQCSRLLSESDECDKDSVVSTVEECTEVSKIENVEGEGEKFYREFACKGHCLVSPEVREDTFYSHQGEARYGNCEKLNIHRQFALNGEKVDEYRITDHYVKHEFVLKSLSPFCEEMTPLDFKPEDKAGMQQVLLDDLAGTVDEDTRKFLMRLQKGFAWCIGYDTKDPSHKNVKCVDITGKTEEDMENMSKTKERGSLN